MYRNLLFTCTSSHVIKMIIIVTLGGAGDITEATTRNVLNLFKNCKMTGKVWST